MTDVFEVFREILLEVQVFGDYFVQPSVQTVPSEVPANLVKIFVPDACQTRPVQNENIGVAMTDHVDAGTLAD